MWFLKHSYPEGIKKCSVIIKAAVIKYNTKNCYWTFDLCVTVAQTAYEAQTGGKRECGFVRLNGKRIKPNNTKETNTFRLQQEHV